jgi:hypothetical protein
MQQRLGNTKTTKISRKNNKNNALQNQPTIKKELSQGNIVWKQISDCEFNLYIIFSHIGCPKKESIKESIRKK